MVIGGCVVQLIGFSHDGTPYPMLAMLIACTVLALAALAITCAPQRRTALAGNSASR